MEFELMTKAETDYKASEKILKQMCTAYRFKKYGDLVVLQLLSIQSTDTMYLLENWIAELSLNNPNTENANG